MSQLPVRAVGLQSEPLSAERTPTVTTIETLVKTHCESGVREALRVIGTSSRGSVFFDQGKIVHAEFGEDIGLRALVQMLRAGPIRTEICTRRWPSHPSLSLEPDTLFSCTAEHRERKRSNTAIQAKAGRITPVAGTVVAARPSLAEGESPGRAVAERLVDEKPDGSPSVPSHGIAPFEGKPSAPRSTTRGADEVVSSTIRIADSAMPASTRVARRADNDVDVTEPEVAAASSNGPNDRSQSQSMSKPAAVATGEASRTDEDPLAALSFEAPAESSRQGRRPRFASVRPRQIPPLVNPSEAAERLKVAETMAAGLQAADQRTTVVRLTGKGRLLAARGGRSDELADAAAYLNELSRLIAADLGRRGRVSLHIRGQGQSLVVSKAEVKDIFAALGPTDLLSSLLHKNSSK